MGSDAVVIRHSWSARRSTWRRWVRGSVINAGDGTHEHPTQALLDAYTMRQRLGASRPAVTIVGDVLHSRVARSNVLLLHTLGADVTLVAPPTLLPWRSTPGRRVSYDFDAVLPKSDVVMMLRVQRERMGAAYFPSSREYSRRYGLDAGGALMPDDGIVMHPGRWCAAWRSPPRSPTACARPSSEQVANGVSVRMAVLYLLLAARSRPSAARPSRRGSGMTPDRWLLRDVRPYGEDLVDVRLVDGLVAEVGTGLPDGDSRVLDGRSGVLLPGWSTCTPTWREPGREDAETVETGTLAAALGGFTAVHAMANTDPVADTAGVVEQVWAARARDAGTATSRRSAP
jgi:hypothetical protein